MIGIWMPIVLGETGYSSNDFKCSCCGKPNKCFCLTKFCCNCGAEMILKEEIKND